MHTYTKMTKKEWKRTIQGDDSLIHSLIHCINRDFTLNAGDKAVNKRGRVPPFTQLTLRETWIGTDFVSV